MSKSDYDRYLNGGDLTRSDIETLSADGLRVSIVEANLQGVDLSRLELGGWRFEGCDLTGARFDRATLEETVFVSCRGAASSFVGSDMQEAVIDGGDFHNASFVGASLGYMRLLRCKATGANFTDAKTFNLHMEEVKLNMALMPKASFRKSLLMKIDLTEADLTGCDFREAVFEDSSLRNAILENCRFEKADLRGADLGGIALRDAGRFKGAVISSDQAADLVRQLGLKVE